MSGNSAFEMVSERGWRRGFGNLLQNELARWWKTRLWWTQCLIWTAACLMMLSDVLLKGRSVGMRYPAESYGTMVSIFQAAGLLVLMQGVLVGEKKDGTAAWLLSKPAARPAFVLSKLVANALGVWTTMVAWSGVVFCALCLIGKKAPPRAEVLLAGLGLVMLHHLFFMTLMLMLGSLCRGRGPVLGIPAAILVAQFDAVRKFPQLRSVLPLNLVMDIGGHTSALVLRLTGQSMYSQTRLIATVALECLAFLAIALWRFNREEF